VLTIGNFDGVHLGHQVLINKAVELSKKLSCLSALLTFDPHPVEVFRPELARPKIFTKRLKTERAKELGIDLFVDQDFNLNFYNLLPEEFIRLVLVKNLKIKALVVGEDYRFGKKAAGDIGLLKKILEPQGILVFAVELKKLDFKDMKISTSFIRNLLEQGNLEQANLLLGSNYGLYGRVVHGDGRGRKLGFPTANIKPEDDYRQILPNGVYVTRLNSLKSVTNVGTRPTFNKDNKNKISIETHVAGNNLLSLYDQEVKLEFLKKIRDEKKFNSVEELKTQIQKDISSCLSK